MSKHVITETGDDVEETLWQPGLMESLDQHPVPRAEGPYETTRAFAFHAVIRPATNVHVEADLGLGDADEIKATARASRRSAQWA
jgi:hypothetical protein